MAFVISTRDAHISPRAEGPRANMGRGFPDRSVIVINVSLLNSAVTVKMDYEENIENARYATNDDTPL
jgi:hypothetical protein